MPSAPPIPNLTAEQAAIHVSPAVLQDVDIIGYHGQYPDHIRQTLFAIYTYITEIKQGKQKYPGLLGLAEEHNVEFNEHGQPRLNVGFLLAVMESTFHWDSLNDRYNDDCSLERRNMLRTVVYALLFKRSFAIQATA